MRRAATIALVLATAVLGSAFAADPTPVPPALTIANLQVTAGATHAAVRWTTSLPAGGAVFYGPAD
ncbi:MAG: hypothetical protein NZ699_12815, partial [Roseiflexus sp.]|nr:hypothetical protein [Roseiflexus sp.]MCS7290006.1 hypothetical protein [Roseiflexus sp.]